MTTLKVDQSAIGKRAELAVTVAHEAFAGKQGVIAKAIKSRNEYLVRLDDGSSYFAFAGNVNVLNG